MVEIRIPTEPTERLEWLVNEIAATAGFAADALAYTVAMLATDQTQALDERMTRAFDPGPGGVGKRAAVGLIDLNLQDAAPEHGVILRAVREKMRAGATEVGAKVHLTLVQDDESPQD